MKKAIIVGSILCLFSSALVSTPANAEISIQANFGEPQPAYVEAPAYVAPTPIYPTYAVEGAHYHEHHIRHERRGHDHHHR